MSVVRPPSRQPMPPHAKRVFRGVIFDVYQWEQKMFDGTVTTFEKIKRPDFVAAIAVTTDGKIVLAEQEQPASKPFLGVVGGRVDEGESPEQAIARELKEETGYQARSFVLLAATQPVVKIDWASFVFAALGCEPVSAIQADAGERFRIRLVTFDEFIKLACQPDFRDPEVTSLITGTAPDPVRVAGLRQQLGL